MALPAVAAAAAAGWTSFLATATKANFIAGIGIWFIKLKVRLGLFFMKVGLVVLLIGILIRAIEPYFDTITATLPPDLKLGVDLILPANFVQCLVALAAVKVAVFIYSLSMKFVEFFMENA